MRSAGYVLGWGAVVAAVVGIAAHLSGLVSNTATRIASFTPVLIGLGVVGLVILLIGRHRVAAVVAAVVVIAGLATQAPLYRGVDEQVSETDLTVMQANIYLGRADVTHIVDEVRDRDVDVLTVIELTQPAVSAFATSQLSRELPYSYLRPRAGGAGAGIYSRYPLSDGRALDGFTLSNLRAQLEVPGAGRRALYALHPLPPYPEPSWRWDGELRRLRDVLLAEPLPLIIGADFNSTYDHRQFRSLLAHSSVPGGPPLLDAAEHLGAGIVATYPANRVYPPFLALDRVLARGSTPTSLTRVDLPGSDHFGVVATVRP
ncbi:endonuclease/exonuclease/phosphatase family protein [Gordonia insulae]|uniref:Endonuclease/exonuclease/phosphatase domain-containing protein n=1 Tax=Gordonia insulae TaxID=2420509 RepID=A0A3G8JKV3_9ACTN|nr:endonuclease/exonuclease/phosphatase family protein [Gordonia insulae]AZG45717.1 hypothetical protein D7316_02317 [Gordonia insulae]